MTETFSLEPENTRPKDIGKYRHLSPSGNRALVRYYYQSYRSSHRTCSVRKDVLRNFATFTGKYLCQGLFFNKAEGLFRTATDGCFQS